MATNPLNAFVSASTGSSNDVRVQPLPKLGPMVQESGLMAGCAKFDQAMESWRAQLEQQLNERLSAKVPASNP